MLELESFHLACKTTLDRFAPLKQKAMRNNNQQFMTKTLRKAIMKRSKLKNKFNKKRNAKNWSNYKQRNYCSNLLKESKTRHFKNVTENKRFWKTKPFFTDKIKYSNNIILTENYQFIREDEKICKIFNTYVTSVTKGLKLRQVDKT